MKNVSVDSLDDYPFPDSNAPGRFRVTKDDAEEYKEKGCWVVGHFGIDTFWC